MSDLKKLNKITADDISQINEYVDSIRDHLASEMEMSEVNEICMQVREEIFQKIERAIDTDHPLNVAMIIQSHRLMNQDLFSQKGAEQVLFSIKFPRNIQSRYSEYQLSQQDNLNNKLMKSNDAIRTNYYTERVIQPLIIIFVLIAFIPVQAAFWMNYIIIGLVALANLLLAKETTNEWFATNVIFLEIIFFYSSLLSISSHLWIFDDFIILMVFEVGLALIFTIIRQIRKDRLFLPTKYDDSFIKRNSLNLAISGIIGLVYGWLAIFGFYTVGDIGEFIFAELIFLVVGTFLMYAAGGFEMEAKLTYIKSTPEPTEHDSGEEEGLNELEQANMAVTSHNKQFKNRSMGEEGVEPVLNSNGHDHSPIPTTETKHTAQQSDVKTQPLIDQRESQFASEFVKLEMDLESINKYLSFGSHKFVKLLTIVIGLGSYALSIYFARIGYTTREYYNDMIGIRIFDVDFFFFLGSYAFGFLLFHYFIDFISWANKTTDRNFISHLIVRRGKVPSSFFFTPPKNFDQQRYVNRIGDYVLKNYITLEYVTEGAK